MDSITQAALGAAVAEAALGRRIGNHAIWWGAALGTLPDLDILAYPLLDSMQQLEWHRGISHSILLAVLLSPILGWLLARLYRGSGLSVTSAGTAVFLVLVTHSLIDVFTVYGTMIFEPFSNLRVATNNLFIIDPLFTLPLLAGIAGAFFCARESVRRRVWNNTGLSVAVLYTFWSFGAKAMADRAFENEIVRSRIPAVRSMSNPTPFNTVVWRGLVETADSFYVAYYSLLDPGTPPRFVALPKNHELLAEVGDRPEVATLLWFSKGYLGVETTDRGVVLHDWRFGEFPRAGSMEAESVPPRSVFAWEVNGGAEGLSLRQKPMNRMAMLRDRPTRAMPGSAAENRPDL